MSNQFAHKLISFFSTFSLFLQSLTPYFYSVPPRVFSAEPLQSKITYNKKEEAFEVALNTKENNITTGKLEYSIIYKNEDSENPDQLEDVKKTVHITAEDLLEKIDAKTCSSDGKCVGHLVSRGILKLDLKESSWFEEVWFEVKESEVIDFKRFDKGEISAFTSEQEYWILKGTEKPTGVPTPTEELSPTLLPVETVIPSATEIPPSTTLVTATGDELVTAEIVRTEGSYVAPQFKAEVWTDKADYAPTEKVVVSGKNFTPDYIYTIVISSSDDPAVTHTDTVAAAADGTFTYEYQLDGIYRPNYLVEIKDRNKAVVALVSFTDAETNYKSPTANGQNGSGDYWDNPSNAYSDDSNYASEQNQERHRYYSYGFGIPSGSTIDGIEVKTDAWSSDNTGCQLGVDLSWNGGTNWTSEKTINLSGAQNTYTLGNNSDVWGRTWSVSDLSDANFRSRVRDIDPGDNCNGDPRIDWIRIKVYYTEQPSPDLTAVKSHIPSGNATVNVPFTWLIRVRNEGDANASFSSGSQIFTDLLPSSNVTYGSVSVSKSDPSVTGTVSCILNGSSTVVCTANGENVVIPPNQYIDVSFTATFATAGAKDNPRSSGGCKADPSSANGVVAEKNENNNTCFESVTVDPLKPDLIITKTNDTKGTGLAGLPFKWIFHVENIGEAVADFAEGETILADNLPSNDGIISYGAPTVDNLSGITTNSGISCSISSSENLACTVTSGPGAKYLNIDPKGSFDVSFVVTINSAGKYVNPRSGGSCGVDSTSKITESKEDNNLCSDTVTLLGPNLMVTKTNNVYGSVNVNQSFTWTLTVTNDGAADAVFTDNQDILQDNLPDSDDFDYSPTSNITVNKSGGVAGNFDCDIDNGDDLDCDADGTVTIPPSGSFSLNIYATPRSLGSFTNPRSGSGNRCQVDPDGLESESNESDNNCSDTVRISRNIVLNPELSQSCGMDTVLILDSSDSMSNADIQTVKDSATSLVNSLMPSTPTRIGIIDFDSNVVSSLAPSTNKTNVLNAINSIGHTGATEYTNWESALQTADAMLGVGGLIVIITDGNPTESSGPLSDLDDAVVVANTIKTGGKRILAVGVNSSGTSGGLDLDNLEAITGPQDITVPPGTISNINFVDVVLGDVSQLGTALSNLTTALCGGTVIVTKLIDADGSLQTTNDQTPSSGWVFDVGGQVRTTGTNGQTPLVELTASTYNVSETVQPTYSVLAASCTGAVQNGNWQGNTISGVEISNSSIVNCTFVNAAPYCGDGVTNSTEQCDDGNSVDGDRCSSTCQVETCGNLILSEYIEGSSFNKALEIYNASGSTVDLNGYSIVRYANGSSTVSNTYNLSGSVGSHNVFVICNNSIDPSQNGKCNVKLPGPSIMDFNGNDVIALRYNSINIDILGTIGQNPGTEWGFGLTSTADNTLVRQCGLTCGDTNGSDPFNPADQWAGYATNTFSYLGNHSTTCPVCGDNIKNQDSEQCDGTDGVATDGSNFCTNTCQLVPVYIGGNVCSGNSTPKKVGEFFVGSKDMDGTIYGLTSGVEYLFRASGVYSYNINQTGNVSDAAYGTRDNWSTIRSDIGIWGTNRGVTSIIGDLGKGLGVIEWDTDNTYDPDNTYEFAYIPTTPNPQFVISDWYSNWYGTNCQNQSCMSDNDQGGLTVEVFECVSKTSVTICKQDQNGQPLPGWVVGLSQPTGFDELIPVTSGTGIDATLGTGAFVVYASGTYQYGNSAMIADAGYSFRPVGIPYGTGGWVNGDDLGTPGGLELKVAGNNITWGGFNAQHEYSYYLTGYGGGNLNLSLWDDYYGDNVNNGNFRAKIDRQIHKRGTGANGCVTFTDVEYGDYHIFEAPIDGWLYQSTTVGSDTVTNYPASVTVGVQVPEITLVNKLDIGTLKVNKLISERNNGEYVDGNNTAFKWILDSETTERLMATAVDVVSGSHSINENTQQNFHFNGWFTNGSAFSCTNPEGTTLPITVNVPAGATKEVTLCNDRDTGSIHFEKIIVPHYGWNEGPQFHFDISGNYDAGGWSLGDGHSGGLNDLPTGHYTLTETPEPETTGTYDTSYRCYTVPFNYSGEIQWTISGSGTVAEFDMQKDYEVYCEFTNSKRPTVTVTKYNDLNNSGTQELGEDLLSGWTMDLSGKIATTSANGKAVFDSLIPGEYTLTEVLQPGWTQTELSCTKKESGSSSSSSSLTWVDAVIPVAHAQPSSSGFMSLNYGEEWECVVGNYFPPARLTLSKFNTTWPNDSSAGNLVEYHLKLTVLDNFAKDLVVSDLPPAGFMYKPGSWRCYRNSVLFDCPEPTYASPGDWLLGNANSGDEFELVYTASINNTQKPGLYKDLAWAYGCQTSEEEDCTIESSDAILAEAVNSGKTDPGTLDGVDNFVGTKVSLAKNDADSPGVDIEKEEKKEAADSGDVLGASTGLPGTGSPNIWTIVSGLLIMSGLLLMVLGFMRKKALVYATNLMVGVSLFIALFIVSLDSVSANGIDYLTIRLEQPKSPTRVNDFTIGFVSMDMKTQTVTVKCYMKKPSSGYSQIGGNIALIAGGNSGLCPLTSSMIDEKGTYQFYATAMTSTDSVTSETISVDYKTDGPGTPTNFNKEEVSDCEYKITWKTADDGGKTTRVEIYRSENDTSFSADSGTRRTTIYMGSNQNGTFNDVVGNCSLPYYYVLRAFDSADNGSGIIGDSVTITTTSAGTTGTTGIGITAGAVPVTNVTLPAGEVSGEVQGTQQSGAASSENQAENVLGVQTEKEKNPPLVLLQWVATHKKITLAFVALLLTVLYAIRYAKKKQNETDKQTPPSNDGTS